MLDICSLEECENLVDVDGYVEKAHGPLYCDHHQPRCSACGNYVFKGECWQCDPEALKRAMEVIRQERDLEGLVWTKGVI